MKEVVLKKLNESIIYFEMIEELKCFWNMNKIYIQKITEHYFAYTNPLHYAQNPLHFDKLVSNILEIDTTQLLNKLKKICNELENKEFVEKYILLLNRQFALNHQFESQYKSLEALNTFNKNLDIHKLVSNSGQMEINHKIHTDFTNSLQSTKQNFDLISQSLAMVEFFDILKNRNENLVLIGANGSGKSTFSRQIKNNVKSQYNSFVAVIPAQKTFGIQNRNSIPLKQEAHRQFIESQTHNKLFKDVNEMRFANSEFSQMIDYLIAEYQEAANISHQQCTVESFSKINSKLEDVIDIWESIITHIQLFYDGQGNIKALPNNGSEYNFMGLSDGEKNIFYCIASVLLVESGGYVIVDEPENHLNMSIVNKLWDRLEQERPDCQFVYLTHNPSFAIGRLQAKILWIKKYDAPSNWEYVEIPVNHMLPQELMVELVGSKKNILFCEGQKDSFDYKLYSILFKDYTIIPAGGHQKAIDYCKAFNENTDLFSLKAIAIIDKDFYEDEEITAWAEKSIYTLDVMEVENILCDDLILKYVQEQVKAEDTEYKQAKEQIFTKIKETKNNQAMEYTRFKIDKILNSLVGKSVSTAELKTQLSEAIHELNPEIFYNDHIQLLNDICEANDYECALRHYNNKGMLGFIGDRVVKGYKNKVISFIIDNQELQQTILNKYFEHIPRD